MKFFHKKRKNNKPPEPPIRTVSLYKTIARLNNRAKRNGGDGGDSFQKKYLASIDGLAPDVSRMEITYDLMSFD